MKTNLLTINKMLSLALFASFIMSLPALAMKETGAYKALANYAAKTNQVFTTKTLFSFFRNKRYLDAFLNFHYRDCMDARTLFKEKTNSDRSEIFFSKNRDETSLITFMDYEKKIENHYKKCIFQGAGIGARIAYSNNNQKTNDLDAQFALIADEMLNHDMKKCDEISYTQNFKEQMNAFNQNRSQQTLFNTFESLATCIKKDGEDEETCTVTFNENEK